MFKDQSIVFLVKERAFANADVFQKVYILNKTWKTPSLTLFPMVCDNKDPRDKNGKEYCIKNIIRKVSKSFNYLK